MTELIEAWRARADRFASAPQEDIFGNPTQAATTAKTLRQCADDLEQRMRMHP